MGGCRGGIREVDARELTLGDREDGGVGLWSIPTSINGASFVGSKAVAGFDANFVARVFIARDVLRGQGGFFVDPFWIIDARCFFRPGKSFFVVFGKIVVSMAIPFVFTPRIVNVAFVVFVFFFLSGLDY
jgi:hypothetical protein